MSKEIPEWRIKARKKRKKRRKINIFVLEALLGLTACSFIYNYQWWGVLFTLALFHFHHSVAFMWCNDDYKVVEEDNKDDSEK